MKVELIPYSNQVTGHDCLLTTKDKVAVCKVRHLKELDFYSRMDDSLAQFAPTFKGVVDVTVLDDAKGYCRFEANWKEVICENTPREPEYISNGTTDQEEISYSLSRKFVFADGCVQEIMQTVLFMVGKFDRSADPRELANEQGYRSNDYTHDQKFHDSKILHDTGQNPWVDRVHRIGRHVKYIGRTIPYIVLENISAGFERPCILDLKMGTQIHDHDCPSEKQRKHIAKNKLTTTCTMGLRLCGLQIYENGSYHCRDKYYGRGLSENGLSENIKLFFSCIKENRWEILSAISNKVSRLLKVVSSLDGYRFNGTSIIIVYEGCESVSTHSADVRVVDFAHSSILTQELDGPDIGFMLGLENLLKVISRLREC